MKGGNGSVKGGGGGSGGRLAVHFSRAFLASSYPDQSFYWTGSMNLEGGHGGPLEDARLENEEDKGMQMLKLKVTDNHLKAADGASGSAYNQKCFGGYTGPFC